MFLKLPKWRERRSLQRLASEIRRCVKRRATRLALQLALALPSRLNESCSVQLHARSPPPPLRFAPPVSCLASASTNVHGCAFAERRPCLRSATIAGARTLRARKPIRGVIFNNTFGLQPTHLLLPFRRPSGNMRLHDFEPPASILPSVAIGAVAFRLASPRTACSATSRVARSASLASNARHASIGSR